MKTYIEVRNQEELDRVLARVQDPDDDEAIVPVCVGYRSFKISGQVEGQVRDRAHLEDHESARVEAKDGAGSTVRGRLRMRSGRQPNPRSPIWARQVAAYATTARGHK